MSLYTQIALVVLALLIGLLNEIKSIIPEKWKSWFKYIPFILLLMVAMFSVLVHISQLEDQNKSSKQREKEYQNSIKKADTLISNLYVVLDNLQAIQNNATNLLDSTQIQLQLQRDLNSANETLLSQTQQVMNSQGEVLNRNEKILIKQNELLTVHLLDKFIVPTVRIVISFKNPIHKEKYNGPKYIADHLLIEAGDYGRFIPRHKNDIFPNAKKLGHEEFFLQYRLFVENFAISEKDMGITDDAGLNTYYYKENDGRFCHAFEFKNDKRKMNLAEFYEKLKIARSEIFIRKNYSPKASLKEVEENEKIFQDQDVQFYLEVPLNLATGAWLRINLCQKNNYIIDTDTDIYANKYYYAKYLWEPPATLDYQITFN